MRKSYQALLIALGLATSVSASSLLINDVHGATSAPVTIQQKLNVAKNMQITTNVYAGFSAPATLPDAKSLLAGDKVNGRNVRVVALYKVSDGTSYYNFKYGDQYYWMDSRAFTEVPAVSVATKSTVMIVNKQSLNKPVKVTTSNYAGFNTPATLDGAKNLITGSQLNGHQVTAVAMYKLSDGTAYYNFKYGSRYYWMDVRAFTDVNTVKITTKQSLNKPVKVTTSNYAGFNTPATLDGAKNLIAGSQLNGHQVTAVAMYKLSDGTAYYNFKYGNRYYWMDVRAFSNVAPTFKIVAKESVNKDARITANNYGGFNTPSPIPGAKYLISGSQLSGNVVHIVAKYKVSNGEWYYNFKFGDRYYWTNTRAFTDVASIVSKESVHMSAKITANNYGGFNTPSPLYGAKYLLSGKTVVNKTVSVVARYKVSNGEYYYNFKYGNRYYWMNTRAFSYYQNPSQYLQISDTQIKPAGPTPYNISYDYEGVKVWLTQRKLGLSADGHYGPATVSAVKRFQRNHGLKADGILNLTTWNKLGYSTGAWNQIDSYISPLKVHLTNSRSEHIEAMINTAYQYMNRPYIVGASSTPAYGVDCSGLTMQALYSAGINPLPSSSYIHAHPGHEWESRVLFANSKLKKVSYGQRQRGDLIFYRSPYDNKIWHVAIYLGNDQVIESWPPCVMVQPIKNSQRSWIAGVGRPFV